MKKHNPFGELFYDCLKKLLLIIRIAIFLMVLGILQERIVSATDLLQQQTVTGKVTDSQTGEAMPGVNISVKGTNIGTVAGADGTYSLSVPNRDATLVFSFIGYVAQEIPSGRQNSFKCCTCK